jgi:hypothetical protein
MAPEVVKAKPNETGNSPATGVSGRRLSAQRRPRAMSQAQASPAAPSNTQPKQQKGPSQGGAGREDNTRNRAPSQGSTGNPGPRQRSGSQASAKNGNNRESAPSQSSPINRKRAPSQGSTGNENPSDPSPRERSPSEVQANLDNDAWEKIVRMHTILQDELLKY